MDLNFRNIIVIGASAGGLEGVIQFCSELPADLPAALFVVQHIPAYAKSSLAQILSGHTALRTEVGQNGRPIEPGTIYTAPSDHHLLIDEDRVLVTKGPKENRFRPAIDTLFRAAAYAHGERVIGIVFSGSLNDGTSGMWTIKQRGGIAMTQSPEEAPFDSMPNSVHEYVAVDYSLPARELAGRVDRLCRQPIHATAATKGEPQELLALEVAIAKGEKALDMGILEEGENSSLACPSCHGALSRFEEGKLIRFRCHTGHAYTADALLAGINENVEKNMWQVMRGLEETNIVLTRIAHQLQGEGLPEKADEFRQRAAEIQQKAERIQQSIQEYKKLSIVDK